MKEIFEKVSEKIAEQAEAASEIMQANLNFAKFSEKFIGVSDATKAKSIEFMNDLIALSPIIEKIGFRTTGISITLGLPPDVTLNFQKFKDITAEEKEEILKEHKDKIMLGTIVNTLLIADNYQQKLNMGSFRFSDIDVCIGLTGGVSFKLVPKE